jgi:creatinine amidohydrolase
MIQEVSVNLLWSECTWEDIGQAAREDAIVVFPVGAIEQHGPMLPVQVDARLAERWAADGAQRARTQYGLKVLVLPTLPYGQSCFHMRFPGTISLRFETYIGAMCEIMRTVVETGFRAIAIVNGNGGNASAVEVARHRLVEELTREGKEARIYVHSCWEEAYFQGEWRKLGEQGLLPEETMGIHAAAPETAEMLADRPHLVKREKMVKPTLTRTEQPGYFWLANEISETGAFGDPSQATAELGERLWDIMGESVARFLRRVGEETGAGTAR